MWMEMLGSFAAASHSPPLPHYSIILPTPPWNPLLATHSATISVSPHFKYPFLSLFHHLSFLHPSSIQSSIKPITSYPPNPSYPFLSLTRSPPISYPLPLYTMYPFSKYLLNPFSPTFALPCMATRSVSIKPFHHLSYSSLPYMHLWPSSNVH